MPVNDNKPEVGEAVGGMGMIIALIVVLVFCFGVIAKRFIENNPPPRQVTFTASSYFEQGFRNYDRFDIRDQFLRGT